jgi:hypothetical protein
MESIYRGGRDVPCSANVRVFENLGRGSHGPPLAKETVLGPREPWQNGATVDGPANEFIS